MNTKNIINTLESIKGKTFQYGTGIYYILGYTIDDENERFVLQTNVTSFERPFEAIEDFLKFWKPATNIISLKTDTNADHQVALFVERENCLINDLVTILKDNITKVQTNKDYIPQAQAINNNINTIVNIAKLQLTLHKPVKSIYRNT